MIKNNYISVIGLEIHIQLSTKSKAYSADENIYGANPNTKISPISLAYPGTLPSVNTKLIEYALKLGISLECDINKKNIFSRKNYFYADLPKGYQITQDKNPICKGGHLLIDLEDGSKKKINLTRIHMEEDAGKSIHDIDPYNSLIDLNRAGVPLLEIVTEPEIRSSFEAQSFVNEIRKIVKYLDICNGNMEEGSLRCDANVSVMKENDKDFGTKVEIKNMNSTRNIKKAIDFEIDRQIELIEQGKSIVQETRNFNALTNATNSMRTKEKADDYRYFTEPDLQPLILDEKYIQSIANDLPLLPNELEKKFKKEYDLSSYDIKLLIEDKGISDYFQKICKIIKNYKLVANFVNGPIKSFLNTNSVPIDKLPIDRKKIIALLSFVDNKKISISSAQQIIFPKLLNSDLEVIEIIEKNNLFFENDFIDLEEIISKVLEKYPQKVIEYNEGKIGLIGLFMGEIMKITKGKIDPKKINTELKKELEKRKK